MPNIPSPFWGAKPKPKKEAGRVTSTETHIHYEGHSMIIDIALRPQSSTGPENTSKATVDKDYDEFVTMAIRIHSHLVEEFQHHKTAWRAKASEEYGSEDDDDAQSGDAHEGAEDMLSEEAIFGPDWAEREDLLHQLAAETERREAEYDALIQEFWVLGFFDKDGEIQSEDELGKIRYQEWSDMEPVEEYWEHVKGEGMMYWDDGMGVRSGECFQGDSYDLGEDSLTQDTVGSVLRSVDGAVHEGIAAEMGEGCSEVVQDEQTSSVSTCTIGDGSDVGQSPDGYGSENVATGYPGEILDSFPDTGIHDSPYNMQRPRVSSFQPDPKPKENHKASRHEIIFLIHAEKGTPQMLERWQVERITSRSGSAPGGAANTKNINDKDAAPDSLQAMPNHPDTPTLTPQFCFSTFALREFLRLSRSAIDDSITQNLNALEEPAKQQFDPAAVSQRIARPTHRTIEAEKCQSFKEKVLFPSWKARGDVISYCAAVATSPDPNDPDAAIREAELAKDKERVIDERLDPYSARFYPREPRTERLAILLRQERGVENIVRTRTWDIVKERCGDDQFEAWEDVFNRWQKSMRERPSAGAPSP
ncbi:hypothetical protein PpBr36_03522 [Pyricularia pennisetigena]|uniref:hypothetical protein n=1 Tax=Pyricularia pennisetigena TaxID=1578925 RepID=UPI001152281D|nr:hypothetical protein PpBr36_03522 [Pyricularia pennisetigena]TLS29932.1 hypothetical protein PpBr36_03522 [Pyricularia pennisetigena]